MSKPLVAARSPPKLRNVAVEFPFLRNVLFLLWCHFREILTTRYTAKSKLSGAISSSVSLSSSELLRGISHLPFFKRLKPKYGRSLAQQSL